MLGLNASNIADAGEMLQNRYLAAVSQFAFSHLIVTTNRYTKGMNVVREKAKFRNDTIKRRT